MQSRPMVRSGSPTAAALVVRQSSAAPLSKPQGVDSAASVTRMYSSPVGADNGIRRMVSQPQVRGGGVNTPSSPMLASRAFPRGSGIGDSTPVAEMRCANDIKSNSCAFRLGSPPQVSRNTREEQATIVTAAASITTSDATAGATARPVEDDGEPIAVGSQIQVDGSNLIINAAIGEGSFGTVWGAKLLLRDESYTEVALKEVTCGSMQALAEASFEGSVLGALSSASSSEAPQEAAKRIPSLIGMQADALGPDLWRVRVAMSKLPGEPLCRFVERTRPPTWNDCGRERRAHLVCATTLAKSMLLQLAPTLEFVASRAYHRDVTPRNILIEQGEDNKPNFGLIDFGLSVDAAQWRLGVSTVPTLQRSTGVPSWRQAGVAGDGRYWPVSSWYMFGYGPTELEKRPGLCLEYKTHLDLHSLGISALQVFVEMLPAAPLSDKDNKSASDAEDGNEEEDEKKEEEDSESKVNTRVESRLLDLQNDWRRYWKDASRFWQCIYDTFRSGGDFKALREAYVQAAVHDRIRRSLTALRKTLVKLREAAQGDHSSLDVEDAQLREGLCALADALLAMVGTGEKADHTASWASLHEILCAPRLSRDRSARSNGRSQTASKGETRGNVGASMSINLKEVQQQLAGHAQVCYTPPTAGYPAVTIPRLSPSSPAADVNVSSPCGTASPETPPSGSPSSMSRTG